MTLRCPAVQEAFVMLKTKQKKKTTKSAFLPHLWDGGILFLLIMSLRETTFEETGLGAH